MLISDAATLGMLQDGDGVAELELRSADRCLQT